MGEFLKSQIEPSPHGPFHSKITTPWGEGGNWKGKIRHEGPIQDGPGSVKQVVL